MWDGLNTTNVTMYIDNSVCDINVWLNALALHNRSHRCFFFPFSFFVLPFHATTILLFAATSNIPINLLWYVWVRSAQEVGAS